MNVTIQCRFYFSTSCYIRTIGVIKDSSIFIRNNSSVCASWKIVLHCLNHKLSCFCISSNALFFLIYYVIKFILVIISLTKINNIPVTTISYMVYHCVYKILCISLTLIFIRYHQIWICCFCPTNSLFWNIFLISFDKLSSIHELTTINSTEWEGYLINIINCGINSCSCSNTHV